MGVTLFTFSIEGVLSLEDLCGCHAVYFYLQFCLIIGGWPLKDISYANEKLFVFLFNTFSIQFYFHKCSLSCVLQITAAFLKLPESLAA